MNSVARHPRLFAALCAAAVSFRPGDAMAQSPDSTALVLLETTWNQAHLDGDVDALNDLWATELVVIVPGMASMNKRESLAFLRSGAMRFQSYVTSDLGVRVYADTAIVTGRLQRTRELRGEQSRDDWRFTKVYVRRDGTWRVVAFRASPSPPS